MMTRRSMVWGVVAVLFSAVNLAGAVIAAAMGELRHAGVHVALLLLGASFVRRIWLSGEMGILSWLPGEAAIPAEPVIPAVLSDRLTHLEQAVEACALKVERVGEGQRFMTHFFAENGIPRAQGDAVAEPLEVKTGE